MERRENISFSFGEEKRREKRRREGKREKEQERAKPRFIKVRV